MDKNEDAFRTISEAADELDLPQHVLRFWETRFPQIRPMKRGGGRRYYRPDDVELLRAIRHLLYSEGYTIKGVQRMLKERGARALIAMPSEAAYQASSPIRDDADSTAEYAGFVEAPPAVSRDLHAVGRRPHDPRALGASDAAMTTANFRAPQEAIAAPYEKRAPAWTAEQRDVLDRIVSELAECRRILGAASI
jgi:DNA-binding transcriptional MerR regulator